MHIGVSYVWAGLGREGDCERGRELERGKERERVGDRESGREREGEEKIERGKGAQRSCLLTVEQGSLRGVRG